MRKKGNILISVIILSLLFGSLSFGQVPEFSGGVNNEYEYQEYVFISGKPIKFVGTGKDASIAVKEDETEKQVTYKLKLYPEDKSIDARAEKQYTFLYTYDKKSDRGQTIANIEAEKFKEKIQIGDDKYELDDFQFSKSDIIDNRPASDFYLGNFSGKKYYKINGDEGRVVVEISGGDSGYENFWGSTQTQTVNMSIDYDKKVESTETKWSGSVEIQTSDSTNKKIGYAGNDANLSSFDGRNMKITNRKLISKYIYDMPEFDGTKPDKKDREKGRLTLSIDYNPKIEGLIVPKFKDVSGHWAQNDIERLYSLEVFDDNSSFFTPDVAMTRLEFTKAIMKASNMRTTIEEPKRRTRRRRNEPEEEAIFEDLDTEDEAYKYIKDGVEKGIIRGASRDLFKPDDFMTKAQAITIMIRALGFENKSPTAGYYVEFSDNENIPYWAKDSIYVAKEIGLIKGDSKNRINPNETLTRAQASSMLMRFLEFLERDLQRDYRENIINFN